jgi:hypothetical protein
MATTSLRTLVFGTPPRPSCKGNTCFCERPYGFKRGGNKICWTYGPNGATLDDMIKYDFRNRCYYANLPAYKDPPPSLGERLRTHVEHILAKKTAMRDLNA